MRIAALVLGIAGGVFGVLAGLFGVVFGGIGSIFDADDYAFILFGGLVAIVIGVTGIIGGALSGRNPGASAVLQFGTGVIGFFTVGWFWTIAALLLLPGSVCAYICWFRQRKQRQSRQTGEPEVTS